MPDLKKMLTLEALSEALPSWLKRSTKPEYNADEIDSTLTTNQFVTASDKDNWNAKGTYSKPNDGIPKSDLSSIVQTSLEKADSALQSETDPTVPSWAKQSSKPSYTQDEVPDGSTYKRVTQTEKDAWSGKQNALTTTQMQAVNSGITYAGVTQISTNQANILYALNTGVKNWFDLKNADITTYPTNISVSKGDNSITVTTVGNKIWSHISIPITLKAGTYHVLATISNRTAAASAISRIIVCTTAGGSGELGGNTFTANGTIDFEFTTTGGTIYFALCPNYNATGYDSSFTASNIMICTADAWNQSHEYQPYAKSNYDLTQYTDGCSLDTVSKSSGSLNDITQNSFAVYNASVTGKPIDDAGNTSAFTGLCETDVYNSSEAMQKLTRLSNGHNWVRTKTAGNWNAWIKQGVAPYFINGNSASIANLLYTAANACGYIPTERTHAGLISVSTDTIGQYALIWFMYKHGTTGQGIQVSNNVIALSAINSSGTLAITGGTAPYNVGVMFFY